MLDATDTAIFETLDLAYEAIENGKLDEATRHLEKAKSFGRDLPEISFNEALFAMVQEESSRMVERLEHTLSLAPDYADAHHMLARHYENEENEEKRRHHDLKTLALDQKEQAQLEPDDIEDVRAFIEGQAEQTLANLPEPFRGRLENVPVLLEALPPKKAVEDGLDPRLLGLFEGPTDVVAQTETPPAPSHIFLFWWNLLDAFGDDDENLAEEIEITILHEIGHYFGLDEDEVEMLGLA